MERFTKVVDVSITPEQLSDAHRLVKRAMALHTVSNIWDKDPRAAARSREFRLTGTLGEIVFADALGLPRPEASFGAIDGQDGGRDFTLPNGTNIDVKTMHRKSGILRPDYALNIPASDVERPGSLTDYYYHITLAGRDPFRPTTALLIGAVARRDLESGLVGIRRDAGEVAVRADGTNFTIRRAIYEVTLGSLRQFSSLLNR